MCDVVKGKRVVAIAIVGDANLWPQSNLHKLATPVRSLLHDAFCLIDVCDDYNTRIGAKVQVG